MSARPSRWMSWAGETFGPIAYDRRERTMRFIEEAIELVQALGMDRPTIESILDRVYSRPPGDVAREFGQCLGCFECLAHVAGVDADAEAEAELLRVQTIPKDEWAARHHAKVNMGIAG